MRIIRLIHNGLAEIKLGSVELDHDADFPMEGKCLNDFSPLTENDIEKLIRKSPTKSCCLDPIPTQLVKECLDILLPILKKANVIAQLLKNFRPISNLPYLSEILEKVASKQLLHHKDTNKLRENFQSAYREFHSSETALLRIQHDLLFALAQKRCVFMVMLDLSTAFDTVNHEKLLNHLSTT